MTDSKNDIAINKVVRSLPIKAPRGLIKDRNDKEWLKHTLIYRDRNGEIKIETPDVTITQWKPVARVY